MKKRILSLVLCAAMLLSMCLFLGAGVTSDTYKVTVNYIYESDSSPVAQATVLQVAKDEALNKEITVPTQLNYTPTLADDTPDEITLDPATGMLKFAGFKPTGNVTVKVLYVAGNAKYTVNHYLQNLNDDEYTLDKSVELTGSIDAYTAAVADLYPGFTAGEVQQSTIAADGTTVVSIYYKRNYYMVQFAANGGVNGPEPVYAKYGATYNMPNGPTKTGYNFAGWFDSDSNLVTEGVVTKNVTYAAGWTPISDKAGVTVIYWGQNANDDEYSYYGVAELTNQKVGDSLTWNDIQNQTAYTCGLEQHKHTSDCKLNCVHTAHDLTCYGLSANAQPITPSDEATKYFAKLSGGVQDGYIYYFNDTGYNSQGDQYYLRLNGEYYKYDGTPSANKGAQVGSQVACDEGWGHSTDYFYKYNLTVTCTHKHTAACYSCGKIEHSHSANCLKTLNKKMDSSLWEYEKSDTVTVDAAGNTVMNVYYTRKVFTLEFHKANSNSADYGTITARWGKNIKSEYEAIMKKAGSCSWSEKKDAGSPWTDYIGVMPQKDNTYYRHVESGSENTMTYYGEDLNGAYQQIFSVTFNGSNLIVTQEDRYEFEGFTYDHGTANGAKCNGAKFYYKRNTYSLTFYSASTSAADKTASVKYQAPLAGCDYTPTSKPATVESDAVFAGWYLNPQCTGEKFDLSAHTMPSNNIALYAKWVNRSYTVKTYTDDSLNTLYTYDGYDGTQSVVKYEKGVAPTNPTKSGYAFVGWFYKDENGAEKPFSFEMGITKDYNLYPKWSNQVNVTYTIQYIDRATDKEIAASDTASARMGSTVTVKSKAVAGYFPELTSTSVQITEENQIIELYYKSGTELTYTVKYVEVVNGVDQDIAPSETKTTTSIQVVESAKDVEGYTPDRYQKTLELTASGENVVTFYYTKEVTINYIAQDGGTVTESSEKLIRTTGEAQGSTAQPAASYKFVGWYKDEGCTQPVDDSWVTNGKITPQKVNGVYEEATYYAKFELDVFDLTIVKSVKDGSTIDPNQTFVFKVKNNDNGQTMEVVITGEGEKTIKNLPMGSYTITEDTAWSWQYTPTEASQTIAVNETSKTVTFENEKKPNNWLTSLAEVINKWVNGAKKIDQVNVKN